MRRRMTALLGLAGFLGLQASAWGQTTYNWNDSGGGSFHTASNWSPGGGPPGSQDVAFFNIAGTYTTTFANSDGQSFAVEVGRGTVTFTSALATADHTWGTAVVGPRSNDVASSSTLNILNIPDFMQSGSLVIGQASGKTGTMNITNARWLNAGLTTVGDSTAGNLSITTSAAQNSVLITDSLSIGFGAGFAGSSPAQGSVNVSGGSARIIANAVAVGSSGGNGQLTVSNGGLVQFESVRIAYTRSDDSSITVTGTNSLMLIDNDLTIGSGVSNTNAVGTLSVLNGGVVNTGGLIDLGVAEQNPTGFVSGTINISGANAILTSGGILTIGKNRQGNVHVSNGGRLVASGIILGVAAGSNGLLELSHTSTSVSTGLLNIGQSGVADVHVSNGAALTASNGTLGTLATGVGTLNLTGLNSAASFTGTLGVGGTSTTVGGTGVVHINNTTTLSVAGQLSLWSGGTVNLNGGTLNVGSIAFNAGNWNWNEGTVNFSQPTTLNNTLLNNLVGLSHTINSSHILGSTGAAALTLASNLTVDGGRLQSSGALNVNAGTILMVNNGGEASSTGVVTNNGTILMNGPTSVMSGNTIDNRGSIRGSGVINNTLSNNTTGQVRVAASDWLTFNGSGHGNQGSVQLLGGVLEFSTYLNTGTQGFISGHGTLIGSSASQGGLGHVNTGTFAFSGGNTNIYGDVQNNTTGRILTTGSSVTTFHDDVLHNGVELRTSSGSSTVFLGSVSGAGPFTGAGLVQFEGDLRPGNSPANVQFAGDVEFSVTARLVTEIGGLAAGSEHDRLTIQGQVSLNGLLDVQLLSAFQPSAGDVFTIIDNLSSNSINGTFTGLQEGAYFVSGGQLWNITYQGGTGNDVMLMAVPEPSTWALLGVTGLGGAAVYWRKRRKVLAETEIS